MESWSKIAFSGPVVRRALMYAIVFGSVYVTINHGDAIIRGEFDRTRQVKAALTVCVPYLVSTLSSVQALRSKKR